MEQGKNTTVVDGSEKKEKFSMNTKITCAVIAVIAVFIVGAMIISSKGEVHKPTVEDQKQLEYDSKQKERDQRLTDQIIDDTFLLRSEESSTTSLLRGFTLPKIFSNAADSRQIQKEEEAIEHVLRSTPAKPEPARPTAQPFTANNVNNSGTNSTAKPSPMFIDSRSAGGAAHVDSKPAAQTNNGAAEGSAGQTDDFTRALLEILSAATAPETTPTDSRIESAQATGKTSLIYSGLTPVMVHEGEMLEAVLVNRLIVNTEPSPVIAHLSRDLFDRSGRYVIFPANSRVIGTSQAINYKGASRLFISFHRIILPNGLSVDLPQSQRMLKALDETGALGIVSHVDRHWMLQFGSAVFLGVIDGIAGYAQRNQQTATAYGAAISRTSENFDRVLDRVMAQYSSIVPTIRVDQGKTLRIYISDDMVISPYARISERSYYGAY